MRLYLDWVDSNDEIPDRDMEGLLVVYKDSNDRLAVKNIAFNLKSYPNNLDISPISWMRILNTDTGELIDFTPELFLSFPDIVIHTEDNGGI